MTVGDLLELLAAGGCTYGAYDATGRLWAAILTASAWLFWLAHCYAKTPLRKPKLRDPRINAPVKRRYTLKDHVIGFKWRSRAFYNRIFDRPKPQPHSGVSPVTVDPGSVTDLLEV